MTDRPLRFCMITTFYPPYNFGGDGLFVQRLAHELADRGHHVQVIHCVDAYRLLAGKQPDAGYASHPNVTFHGLRSRFGLLSVLATQQTGHPTFRAARIREILGQGFDVIHYHNISLIGGPGVLAYGGGIKFYTMHEHWLVCPMHVLFRFNRAACTKRSCVLCSLAGGRPPQWWRYTRVLEREAQHVDAFIAPSRSCIDKHHAMGFDRPITRIPLFASTAAAAAEPSQTSQDLVEADKPFFLYVGRLEKLKGLHTLIPVFRRYERAQLWVAGTGHEEKALRKLADRSQNIRFLGFRSGTELRALYRAATAVIVPSITFEVFPLVVVEALREHTPVIARNLGALAELTVESGGGFVYDNDDELVSAMDRLSADTAYRSAIGDRGFAYYQREWTVEAHMRRYFSLIHRAATGRRTGGGTAAARVCA